jgi:hypothetical protein
MAMQPVIGCSYSLSASQIDDEFPATAVFLQETSDNRFDGVHSQPVPPVNQRVAANELLHKGLIKVWFAWVIQFGNTSFGDDTAIICLRLIFLVLQLPTHPC